MSEALKPIEKRVVAAACGGLEAVAEPFEAIAARAGLTEQEVIETLRSLSERGIVRKVAAILDSRSMGLRGNALVAWRIEEAEIERVGRAFAAKKEVTHCYERKSVPRWPYNLYTMVHGASEDELRAWAAENSREAGTDEYVVLFTRRELKKTPAVYRFEGLQELDDESVSGKPSA